MSTATQAEETVIRASAVLAVVEQSAQTTEADKQLAFDRLKLTISRARHRGCWQMQAEVIA